MKKIPQIAVFVSAFACWVSVSLAEAGNSIPIPHRTELIYSSHDAHIDLEHWRGTSEVKTVHPLVVGDDSIIEIYTLLGPARDSLAFGPWQDHVISVLKTTGHIEDVAVLTGPADYLLTHGVIVAGNLLMAKNIDLWAGSTNIPPGFEGQRGQILITLHVIRSKSGGNTVSLAMLSTKQTSLDDGGALDDATGFIGSYTTRVPLIQVDGSGNDKLIESGSTEQLGRMAAVITVLRVFDGGDTVEGREEEFRWINKFPLYRLLIETQVIGNDSTKSSATVRVGTQAAPRPTLSIAADSVNVTVKVLNPADDVNYRIERRSTLDGSTLWQLVAVLNKTNTYVAPRSSSGMEFFRTVNQ